jgi:DnaJ-class molecular chaperone
VNNLKEILRWYDIIGVPYFSDYDIIKTAFRKKIKKLHPDVRKAEDDQEVKEIIASYKSLQTLYKDRDLFDYYKNEFLASRKHKKGINFDSKRVKIVFKIVTLALVIILSILLFDNVVNIILFISVVVGGYFAFTKL